MKRVVIYDRYLSTLGGGERYVGKMAEVLSSRYDVTLLTDRPASLEDIENRFNVDLSGVKLNIIPCFSNEYAARYTSSYDLFINATYMSSMSGCAKQNLYLVYFPASFDADFDLLRRVLIKLLARPSKFVFSRLHLLNPDFYGRIEPITGLYDVRRFYMRRTAWTSGEARFFLSGLKESSHARLVLKVPDFPADERFWLKVVVGNKVHVSHEDIRSRKKIKVKIETDDLKKGEEIEVISSSYRPSESGFGRDSRLLGIGVQDQTDSNIFLRSFYKMMSLFPQFILDFPLNLSFVRTYQHFISISDYVSYWLKRRWGVEAQKIYPPVDVESLRPKDKEDIIVSVGRFFKGHHNKKQDELVRAFRQLCDEGLKHWRLWLIGGVSGESDSQRYLDKVRSLASGYPIEIYTNIRREFLIDALGRAKVFWHAAGLGEDDERSPEKSEHFGISTVEAMASGAVPVVIAKGGQKEIVHNDYNGLLFDDVEGLKYLTMKLIDNEALLGRYARNAQKSADIFGQKQFTSDLGKHIGKILG
ncbi:MAG: glycosyltransferase [Actinobacteria bacterium]|nr:glycosyltransferase [Actinomycetota bacterium]